MTDIQGLIERAGRLKSWESFTLHAGTAGDVCRELLEARKERDELKAKLDKSLKDWARDIEAFRETKGKLEIAVEALENISGHETSGETQCCLFAEEATKALARIRGEK